MRHRIELAPVDPSHRYAHLLGLLEDILHLFRMRIVPDEHDLESTLTSP
jgi:hypothetical protein